MLSHRLHIIFLSKNSDAGRSLDAEKSYFQKENQRFVNVESQAAYHISVQEFIRSLLGCAYAGFGSGCKNV
jgi:hypothetical protein